MKLQRRDLTPVLHRPESAFAAATKPNAPGISPRTRRDYIKQINRIERDFGDYPIKA
jgi:hypothetical protein